MDVVDGGTCTDTTKNQDFNACTTFPTNGLCTDTQWTTEADCAVAGSCVNSTYITSANGIDCSFPTSDESADDNDAGTCTTKGNCYVRYDIPVSPTHVLSCVEGHEYSFEDSWVWRPWIVSDLTISQCTQTNAETWISDQGYADAPEDDNTTYYRAAWEQNEFEADTNTWTANSWVVNTWEPSNTWFLGGSWTPDNTWAKQHDWLAHIWEPNNYSWSNNRWVNDGNVWGQYYTWDNPNSYEFDNTWLTNTWESAGNSWASQYTWWDNSYLNAGHSWYDGSIWNTYTFTSDGNSWGQQHTWNPYIWTSANNNWGQQHTWSLNSFGSDNYDWHNHYQWENATTCTTNTATWIPDPAFQNPPDSYAVYRALSAEHLSNPPEYHYLETISHVGAGQSQQTYVDDESKTTNTYYYKVTQKSEGVESKFSDFDSGYETQ
jgi:hypothetical protein